MIVGIFGRRVSDMENWKGRRKGISVVSFRLTIWKNCGIFREGVRKIGIH